MNTHNNNTIHSFSRELASLYGVNGAILLCYLGHKIQRSEHQNEGRQWYYETLDDLAGRYPYLSRTAIYQAIKSLTSNQGPLLVGHFNKHGFDRTNWYAFRDNRIIRQLQTEPLYFKVSDASAFGLTGAVLMGNLAYWIKENRKKDANYSFHTLSPTILANHLPFSRSTIQRALNNLVASGILNSRQPSDGRRATEYGFASDMALVDEVDLADGSIQNMGSDLVPNSIQDMAGSNQTLPESIQDMAASIQHMEGSERNDYTILIDNSLKALCLKERDLEEDCFKARLVLSSHSQTPNSELNPSSTSNSGGNEFSESIVAAIPGERASEAEVKASSVCPPADPDLSTSSSSGVSLPDPKPSFAPVPNSAPSSYPGFVPLDQRPAYLFLDAEVHKACQEVERFHRENSDESYKTMGRYLVEAINNLIAKTLPEELGRIASLPNQKALDEQLHAWSKQYFEDCYSKLFPSPASPDYERYRQLYLKHGRYFLNMGFHRHLYEADMVYGGCRYYSKISLAIYTKLRPWYESQRLLRQDQIIKERTTQYGSPDLDKESIATLSAPEKMQVFNQSLQARNRIGRFDHSGTFTEQVVNWKGTSMNLARKFFQLNPQFTVADLNRVLDACLDLPPNYGMGEDLDSIWHAHNAKNISLFIKSVDVIASQLNLLIVMPG